MSDTIKTNSLKPKKGVGDQGTVEQFSIKDQVEADKYDRATGKMTRNTLGIRSLRTNMPGSRD